MKSLIGPPAQRQASKIIAGGGPSQKRRDPIGTLTNWVNDGATQNVILSFTVPQGSRFWLYAIVQVFNLNPNSAGTYNPGDIVWTLDRNTPAGATIEQAIVVEDLANISTPLGSVSPMYSEFAIVEPTVFEPGDVIRSKAVVGVSVIPGGGYFTSIFRGCLTPVK